MITFVTSTFDDNFLSEFKDIVRKIKSLYLLHLSIHFYFVFEGASKNTFYPKGWIWSAVGCCVNITSWLAYMSDSALYAQLVLVPPHLYLYLFALILMQ